MSVLVLSPHRDDAAFSCGLLLAGLVSANVPVQIANICTISDYAPYANLSSASDPVMEVTRLRAEEDVAFVHQLQLRFPRAHECVRLLDFGWKDAPLRHSIATEDVLVISADQMGEIAELAASLRSLAPASVVLAPLALGGHLDHRMVRQAAIDAWPRTALLFYEDLPYACRMSPEDRAVQTQRALPWTCEHAHAQPARSGDKRHMASCYGSQIADSVADEMEDYGAAMGWTERLYGTGDALGRLAAMVSLQQAGKRY